MLYASAVFPVEAELIVVGHAETGSWQGMRLLTRAGRCEARRLDRRHGWSHGGEAVPAGMLRASVRILQRVTTV